MVGEEDGAACPKKRRLIKFDTCFDGRLSAALQIAKATDDDGDDNDDRQAAAAEAAVLRSTKSAI